SALPRRGDRGRPGRRPPDLPAARRDRREDRMTFDPGLLARITAWIDDDPDGRSAAELRSLLTTVRTDGPDAAAATAELTDRFAAFLEFGTAGLRGALGGGPNRMNRAVVIRAAAGLTRYLLDTLAEQGADTPLVV